MAPEIVADVDNALSSKGDKEDLLRGIFAPARNYMQTEISELLSDFRAKRSLGESCSLSVCFTVC